MKHGKEAAAGLPWLREDPKKNLPAARKWLITILARRAVEKLAQEQQAERLAQQVGASDDKNT